MRKSVLIMAALLLFAALLSVQAQTRMHHKGKGPAIPNMTEEQKENFDNLQYEHRKEVINLRSQIKLNRLEIGKALKDDNFDENNIKELVNKNSELQAQIKNSFVNMWLNVYKTLDENQKEAWKTRLLKMGDRHEMPRYGHKMKGMRHPGNPDRPPMPDKAPPAPEAPDQE